MSPLVFDRVSDLPLTPRSLGDMGWNHTGSWRYLRPLYRDKTAPCSEACPAGEDLAQVELLAGQGAFEEAWLRIREENPLPGVCGRVCFHPCEGGCNRGEYDEPVSVQSLERFVADHAWKQALRPGSQQAAPTGRRVAVVGAGPAGLTASYHLKRAGHHVALFDAREEPGGLLRYAIPEYRLPVDALRWEVGLLLGEGIVFSGGRRLGENLTWEDLAAFDAVFLALGAWTPAPLDVPGEELAHDGLELLERVRRGDTPRWRGPVAVLGGGNTALDVARTLLRLGAEPTLYYRRRAEDMPALADERQEAEDEGIPIRSLLAPLRLERAENGNVRLVLAPQKILEESAGGRPRVVPSGHPPVAVEGAGVFRAIGAGPSQGFPSAFQNPRHSAAAGLHLRRMLRSGEWAAGPPVFLGGDPVNERRTVVHAIASGKEAAVAIDAELRGVAADELWSPLRVGRRGAVSMNKWARGDRTARQNHVVAYDELNTSYFQYLERRERPCITREERRVSFDEVKMRISGSLALKEAERCFHCGLCDQCDNCSLFCPDVAVKRDQREGTREIDYAFCKGCGVCVSECPRNAMLLTEEPR